MRSGERGEVSGRTERLSGVDGVLSYAGKSSG